MLPPPPRSTLFPYTTLFRSHRVREAMTVLNIGDDMGPLGGANQVVEADETYVGGRRSEEHTSELQSHHDLVCRLLLEKKKKKKKIKYVKKKHNIKLEVNTMI